MNATMIATTLFTGGPLYLVWLGAVAFAAMKWKSHPRVSMYVGIAGGGSILVGIVSTIVRLLIPVVFSRMNMGYTTMSLVYGSIGFIDAVATAAAFGLLVFAVYAGRPEVEAV